MVYSVLVNTLMAYSVYVLDNRVLQIIVLSFIVVFNVLMLLHQTKQNAAVQKEMKRDYEHQAQQSERRRKTTLEQCQRFVNTLNSGVIRINAQGVIRMLNHSAAHIFGDQQLENKHFDVLKAYEHIYKVIEKGFSSQNVVHAQHSIHNEIYDISVRPLFIYNTFNGLMVNIHDITSIKTAEQFQKRFTADVTHELRNPLSSIRGFSEIINRESMTNLVEIKRLPHMIEKETKRLETMIADLLTISKMDRLDYHLTLEAVNIKGLYDEIITVLKPKIQKKALRLEENIEPSIVELDKEQFRQVLINLITNAVHYTDEGFIRVIGYVEDTHYHIVVEDSGIGIPTHELDKIFKRFHRVEAARSRDKGGSGLGLSIVKNVTHKHGGSVNVVSKLNEGTTLSVQIPIKNKNQY